MPDKKISAEELVRFSNGPEKVAAIALLNEHDVDYIGWSDLDIYKWWLDNSFELNEGGQTIENVKNVIINEGLLYAIKDFYDYDEIEDLELQKLWFNAEYAIQQIESGLIEDGYNPGILIHKDNNYYIIVDNPYKEVPVSEIESFPKEGLTKLDAILKAILTYVGLSLEDWENDKFAKGGLTNPNYGTGGSQYQIKLVTKDGKFRSKKLNAFSQYSAEQEMKFKYPGCKIISTDKIYKEGGEVEYMDLSTIKPEVVNDIKSKIPEIKLVKLDQIEIDGLGKVHTSEDAARVFRAFWENDQMNVAEHMNIMLLNKANKAIYLYQHSKGSTDGTMLDVQMVAAAAIKALAKGVIIAHNHPSGNLEPSTADIAITKKLSEALKLFNISLLDSLIITRQGKYSLAEEGKMKDGGKVSAISDAGTVVKGSFADQKELFNKYRDKNKRKDLMRFKGSALKEYGKDIFNLQKKDIMRKAEFIKNHPELLMKNGGSTGEVKFLAKDRSGRSMHPYVLDAEHIKRTWDLQEVDEDSEQTLADFINDSEPGDRWKNGPTSLENLGNKFKKGGMIDENKLAEAIEHMKKNGMASFTGQDADSYGYKFENYFNANGKELYQTSFTGNDFTYYDPYHEKNKGTKYAAENLNKQGYSYKDGGKTGGNTYSQYVENIYSRQSEQDVKEQLASFARENGYYYENVEEAVRKFQPGPETNAWDEPIYSKETIAKMIDHVSQFANGGSIGKSFLHLYKLTYPDGKYIVESYDGAYMSPKEAMQKMGVSLRGLKSYKYKGVSSESKQYEDWYHKKDIGYSDTEAWDEVFQNTFAKGGSVGKIENQYVLFKEAQDLWDAWSKKQREHFIHDHKQEIEDVLYDRDDIDISQDSSVLADYNWSQLPKEFGEGIKWALFGPIFNHKQAGQYGKGGKASKFDNHNSVSETFTDENGTGYWVEENIGDTTSFSVVAQHPGFPASEAYDDWFGNKQDAIMLAKDMAEGIVPVYKDGGRIEKQNHAALQTLIGELTDISIDLEDEDETATAGLRFELEDAKGDVKQAMVHVKEFEEDWLNDIEDLSAKKEIRKSIEKFKNSVNMQAYANGGGTPQSVTMLLSGLNLDKLPEKERTFVKENLLTNVDIDLIPVDDPKVEMMMELLQKKYPAAFEAPGTEPEGSEEDNIRNTITGLQFLADDGDEGALATIEGLKLLLPDGFANGGGVSGGNLMVYPWKIEKNYKVGDKVVVMDSETGAWSKVATITEIGKGKDKNLFTVDLGANAKPGMPTMVQYHYNEMRPTTDKMKKGGAICDIGMRVQTLLFNKKRFTEAAAKKWAKDHKHSSAKVDITDNNIRLRQHEPSEFEEDSFKTITIQPGVQAVVACPK